MPSSSRVYVRSSRSTSAICPSASSASCATRWARLLVLDAAAAVDLLVGGRRSAWVEAQLRRSGDICAPHLLDIEVTGAFRRLVGLGAVPESRAEAALAALRALRIARYEHVALIPRIWALRGSVTAADAAYVALAEALDAPLVTTDARLARAPGVSIRIVAP